MSAAGRAKISRTLDTLRSGRVALNGNIQHVTVCYESKKAGTAGTRWIVWVRGCVYLGERVSLVRTKCTPLRVLSRRWRLCALIMRGDIRTGTASTALSATSLRRWGQQGLGKVRVCDVVRVRLDLRVCVRVCARVCVCVCVCVCVWLEYASGRSHTPRVC